MDNLPSWIPEFSMSSWATNHEDLEYREDQVEQITGSDFSIDGRTLSVSGSLVDCIAQPTKDRSPEQPPYHLGDTPLTQQHFMII